EARPEQSPRLPATTLFRSADAAEAERRHGAEVARLRAAMVDLERHLESRARAEIQLKRRIQDLERAAQAKPPAADPAEVARLKADRKSTRLNFSHVKISYA